METNLAPQETEYDVQALDRSYRKGNQVAQTLFLSVAISLLIMMAYAMFGTRIDREKFTTDVTPVHVELNPITDNRQTAGSGRNLQL